jgi:mannosyltransferase OCH1-like enzyme
LRNEPAQGPAGPLAAPWRRRHSAPGGPRLSLISLLRWQGIRLAAILRGEFPLGSINDSAATAAYHHAAIPPIVYQTWSSNHVGRTHFRQVERFRQLNPELSFVLFDDAQMVAYMARHWAHHPIHEVFASARYAQLAADVFRYCLLYERGGFYFDISKGLNAPICSLLRPDATGFIGYEHRLAPSTPNPAAAAVPRLPDNIVAQYGFGFAPTHPLLGLVLEDIVQSYPRFRGRIMSSPKAAILEFTGPDMFTRAVRRYLAGRADPHLVQASVDFEGQAIWTLKGSYVRFFDTPPYKFARDDTIVQ